MALEIFCDTHTESPNHCGFDDGTGSPMESVSSGASGLRGVGVGYGQGDGEGYGEGDGSAMKYPDNLNLN